ncbi:MAG: DUF4910 domain-containing protein [Rhodospirillaceae bacterium]|nr:DUF4910 domain-containing protein [Rhodospirillaceae bacterium]
MNIGHDMHAFVARLFPICRSLTGEGTRETLRIIKGHLPDLSIHEVPSGTQVFDWVIPDEWNIRSATLVGPDGATVADFGWTNLHVVGYSEPVDVELGLDELQEHLFSLPEQPDAIPYVTSYYKRFWGFCLSHRVRAALKPGTYRARIDSTIAPGRLSYGELLIPGQEPQEVFLSTNVCHPSMANNELSGLTVTTWLAKWLLERPRRYSYRIVFIPETIGSITYLSRHLEQMKERVVAGFVVACVGDERVYSFLSSRNGNTLADRVARHVLDQIDPNYMRYSFLNRGSDERQYCAPGVDLPVVSVMRSKYCEYPEYHTSLDDLTLVTPAGLEGGYTALRRCIEVIESNRRWQVAVLGEPQLGKRGLFPSISLPAEVPSVKAMMNMIAYCDGTRDLVEVAELIGVPAWQLVPICERLASHDLLRVA